MNKPLLKPKNDLIFKLIFGKQENADILTSFLQSILDINPEDYIGLTIIDPQSKIDKLNDKTTILDIKLEIKQGFINIELQINPYASMEDRIVYGISKTVTNQLTKGSNYNFKKVISIVITDYILIKEHNMYHDTFRYHSEKTGHTFSKSTEIHTLELPKLPQKEDNSMLWNWLKFMKSENMEEFSMVAERAPQINKAVAILKELSEDEVTRMLAHDREMAEWDRVASLRNARNEGKNEGRNEGIQEGIQKGKLEMTRNAFKMGLSLEQISTLTELDISTLKSILN
jgi:predicted transposase/invertase (TIGR01784 family)